MEKIFKKTQEPWQAVSPSLSSPCGLNARVHWLAAHSATKTHQNHRLLRCKLRDQKGGTSGMMKAVCGV